MLSLIHISALVYGIYALIQIALAPTPEAAHSFMHDLYFESAGMILTLVTLGKFFEAVSYTHLAGADGAGARLPEGAP